jgi:hypothetical protein
MATFILKNTTSPVNGIYAGQLEFNTSKNTLVVSKGGAEVIIAKLDELNSGSLYLSGGISASGDITASNMFISGNLAISGNLFLGNNQTDNINALGVFTSDLKPGTPNQYNIGAPDNIWANIYGAIRATNGVISGSSQITSILPTGLVSGSSQVNYTQLSGISNNIVSASSDSNNIDFIINGGSITANLYGGVVSGSTQIIGILSSLNSYTQSNDTTNTTQNNRLSRLEESTASLNALSGSVLNRLSRIEESTSSLNTFSASQNVKDETLRLYTASVDTKFTTLQAYTTSVDSKFTTLQTYTASVDSKILRIQESTASINLFTASNGNTSLNEYTTSVNTLNTLQTTRIDQLAAATASVNSFTASNGNTSLNTFTQSFNTAINLSGANVTVNGNLTVAGTTTAVNSTTVQLGDNIIELNGNGAANGGLYVKDPTAPNTATGSMVWDSTNDYWKAGTLGNETKVLLAGGDNVVTSSAQVVGILTSLNSFSASNGNASLNSYTQSNDTLNSLQTTRIDQLAAATASVNSFSASTLGHITDINIKTGSFESKFTTLGTYTASIDSKILRIQESTASLNSATASLYSYTASLNNRLNRIEESTSSLNTFSASENTKSETLRLYTASIDTKFSTLQSYTASINDKFTTLQTLTASVAAQISRLQESTASLNLVTSSLHSYTSSLNNRLNRIEESTSSLNTFSASINGHVTDINGWTASVKIHIDDINAWTGSQQQKDLTLLSVTASLNLQTASFNNWTGSVFQPFSTSVDTRLDSLEYTVGILSPGGLETSLLAINSATYSLQLVSESLHLYTQSVNAKFSTLGTYTGSVDSTIARLKESTASLNLFSASENTKSETLRLYTASVDAKFTTLQSLTASNLNRFIRIEESTSSLNSYTQSLKTAITVSGTDVTVAGNLTVGGTTTTINSTTVNIGDNIIQLNGTGAANGGLVVRDATAGTTVSGSLLWDTTNDRWIAGPLGSEAKVLTDGMGVISGSGQLGSYETTGRGIISSSAQIDALFNLDGIVSGSSQINYTQLGGISNNIVSASTDSNNIDFAITNGNITANLFGGVVSGSAQVVGILSSLNTYTGSNDTTNTAQNNRLNRIEESTSSLNSFSASENTKSETLRLYTSSIDTKFVAVQASTSSLNTFTSSINTTIKTKLDTDGVLSGSIQVFGGSNIISASTDSNNIDFIQTGGTLTANLKGGVVSGSSQINYTQLSGIPSGIISSSAQIDTLFNIDGLVSGSSQINYTQLSGISANIISSSSDTAQVDMIITGGSISANLKGGVVSGSGQIDVSSTTGDIALGSRTSGNYVATITGTENQIVVSGNGVESAAITLSTPQNINTSANVQFGSLGIGTAASGVSGEIRATGDIVAFYSSDERLKENIQPIVNALEKVEAISGNTYDWKDGFETIHSHKGHDLGVIAQEVQSVLPEVVMERESGYLAVDYVKLVPVLIQAVKELSAKIKELESK